MSGITILPWNEFLSYSRGEKFAYERFPPFQYKKKFISKDDVIIIGNEPHLSNWPAVNTVQTMDDLKRVKEQLCTRPLILLVQCGKHVAVGQRLTNRGTILSPSDLEWWVAPSTSPWNNSPFFPVSGTRAQDPRPEQFLRIQFAVVVDTSLPSIQRQLTDGFKTAEMMLRKRNGFCLEFDFNPVILDWWLNQGPRHWLRLACMDTAYCIGARIGVTNTRSPCHVFDFGVWWSLCLPCYCVLAFSYKIWRSLICQIWDHYHKIEGEVQVVSDINDVRIHQMTSQPSELYID